MNEDKVKQEYDKFISDRKERGVEFKNLHSEINGWFYEIPWTLKEESGVHTFIKVGPYGTEDIQVITLDEKKVSVNYAEPFQEFDSMEDAYICHNWLWVYFEENQNDET